MRLKIVKPRLIQSFRKHSITLALLAAGLAPHTSQALGLGAINYESHLGEPLNARIDLVNLPDNLSKQNILVQQVNAKNAEAMGVEIVSGWLPLEFTVDTRRSRFQIQVKTRRPIKEPYINFLVELKWPKGTLYREYTLLLDPIGLTQPKAITVEKIAKTALPTVAQESSPIKTSTYRIQAGDTLNHIAARVITSTGMEIRQIVEWVYKNNRDAFGSGGKNHLLAGAILQLPGDTPTSVNTGPQPKPTVVEPVAGRVVLSASPSAPANTPLAQQLQTALLANHQALEQLSKENRDLKERLDFIENSDYVAKLEQLVQAQQQELALLQETLATQGSTSPPEAETVLQLTPLAARLEQAPAYFWGLMLAGLTVLLSFLYAIVRLRFQHLYPFEDSTPEQAHGIIGATSFFDDIPEPLQPQQDLLPNTRQDRNVQQAVAEEARKVQLIRQQILIKTGRYVVPAHIASNDTHLVEEIEIDPDLEAYLKIK